MRIVRNHPLPDGNKRLGRQALTMFCALNGQDLHVPADDAVTTMHSIAAGELEEAAVAALLTDRLDVPRNDAGFGRARCDARVTCGFVNRVSRPRGVRVDAGQRIARSSLRREVRGAKRDARREPT